MNASTLRLAYRAGADPFFLAFALAEYAAAEGLDDPQLAAALGTTADLLAHARLCQSPRTDPDGFQADVDRIAAKFALDRDVLAVVARHGQVVAAMRADPPPAPAPETNGSVLAARDRPPS